MAMVIPASEKWGLRLAVGGFTLLIVFYGMTYALLNQIRPLFSKTWIEKDRTALYFHYLPWLEQPYTEAMDVLKADKAQEIGLLLGSNDWEYPIWILAKERWKKGELPLLEHVMVENRSSLLPEDMLSPLYIISTKTEFGKEITGAYEPIYRNAGTTVLRRKYNADKL